jgi:hypothetical protein
MPAQATRPAHSLTFEQACEIVAPLSRAARNARWEALVAECGLRPGVAPVLSPEEAEAEKWDRYNEPAERYDDGFDVERWAGAGR